METFTEYELEKQYDEMLDDCYPEVEICGMKYAVSRTLKEIDPTAYRCGFNDWMDSEGYDETDDGKGYFKKD